MELMTEEKKGFKKTEVGLIPEDWLIKEFGDVTEPSNTKISSDQVYTKLPCIELEHIKKDIGQIEGYSNLKDQKSLKTKFNKGDVLFGKLRPYLRKYYFAEFDGACSTEMWVFNTREGYSNKFLYYLVQRDTFIEAANKSTGTHMPRADWSVIKEYPVALPPTLAEQQAIASALSDVDELIRSLDGLIHKKQAIKKGTMQQLLSGKKRLPGFDGEWEVKRIEDCLIKFQNGNAFSARGYVEVGIPIVSMAQIGLDGEFNFDINKVNKWPKSEFSRLSDFHLKSGDIIMSMTDVTPQRNLIGRMAMVKSNNQLLLNQRVGLLKLDYDKINPVFLKSLSNLESWREYFKAVSSLGVQANISTKQIKNAEIRLPSLQEQNAIAQILSDMDRELHTLRQKREKYVQIKQGMMQELLTGRIRIYGMGG